MPIVVKNTHKMAKIAVKTFKPIYILILQFSFNETFFNFLYGKV
jgi:hypothetical protein